MKGTACPRSLGRLLTGSSPASGPLTRPMGVAHSNVQGPSCPPTLAPLGPGPCTRAESRPVAGQEASMPIGAGSDLHFLVGPAIAFAVLGLLALFMRWAFGTGYGRRPPASTP